MNTFKTLKRRGNALLIIVILIVFIAILVFLFLKFGLGGGGDGDGSGSGRSETGIKTTVVENVKPPVVEPVKPPVVENKDDSKLYLNWNNPKDFSEIENKINNQFKVTTKKVIIKTKDVLEVPAEFEEKIEELIKNKNSDAELKLEQLK